MSEGTQLDATHGVSARVCWQYSTFFSSPLVSGGENKSMLCFTLNKEGAHIEQTAQQHTQEGFGTLKLTLLTVCLIITSYSKGSTLDWQNGQGKR